MLTSDELRKWAHYIDNPDTPRPFGPNPAAINQAIKACFTARLAITSYRYMLDANFPFDSVYTSTSKAIEQSDMDAGIAYKRLKEREP